MVRSVHVTVPKTEHSSTLTVLSTSDHVHGLATLFGDGVTVFAFKSDDRRLQNTLKRLNNIGVGTRFGTIDVMGLVTTLPPIKKHGGDGSGKKQYRVDDRMTVEEIRDAIDGQSRLTFDFLAMTVVASLMSATGLVGDSATTVVSSMLISPLMGPILCLTFGVSVRDRDMVKRGIVNATIAVALAFTVGIIVGACITPYYFHKRLQPEWSDFLKNTDLGLSSEMIERGTPSNLLLGLITALPSGIGVTLSITTSNGINSLIGVAISAALVPPVVNAGLCLSLGLLLPLFSPESAPPGVRSNLLLLSLCSFSLFLIDVLSMLVVGVLMMRLKKVGDVGGADPSWRHDYYNAGDPAGWWSLDSRSSFFRAGLEMLSKGEVAAKRRERGEVGDGGGGGGGGGSDDGGGGGFLSSSSASYATEALLADEEGGEQDDAGGGDWRQPKAKKAERGLLASFKAAATSPFGGKSAPSKRNSSAGASAASAGNDDDDDDDDVQNGRDTFDMFSPRNFEQDLRDVARSLSVSDNRGQHDGFARGDGRAGDDDHVVIGGDAGGAGFRLDAMAGVEEDVEDGNHNKGRGEETGGGYVSFDSKAGSDPLFNGLVFNSHTSRS